MFVCRINYKITLKIYGASLEFVYFFFLVRLLVSVKSTFLLWFLEQTCWKTPLYVHLYSFSYDMFGCLKTLCLVLD